MGAADLLHTLQARGLTLQADGNKLLVSPTDRLTDEIRATIRANKAALIVALTRPTANDPAAAAPVVRLRIILQQDNGERVQAVLAIPKARYDGLRVLELFEQHRMAGTTRVVTVTEEAE